jgi:predicted lipoprotein with Yx(FWY)xxD motif
MTSNDRTSVTRGGMVLAAIPVAIAALSLSVSADAAVKRTAVTTTTTTLGKILVDSRGRTLYLFKKDRHGKSACSGQCATFWPPVIASGKPFAGRGVKQALLGASRRKDGRMQVTYDHHPLYRFAEDKKKGQTNGEGVTGFGAKWFAVSPTGAGIVSAPTGPGY